MIKCKECKQEFKYSAYKNFTLSYMWFIWSVYFTCPNCGTKQKVNVSNEIFFKLKKRIVDSK